MVNLANGIKALQIIKAKLEIKMKIYEMKINVGKGKVMGTVKGRNTTGMTRERIDN